LYFFSRKYIAFEKECDVQEQLEQVRAIYTDKYVKVLQMRGDVINQKVRDLYKF